MAITINKDINTLAPAYNRNDIVLDSTNKTETNFKYVIDIVIDATIVNRLLVNPQPVNGRGRVDVNNILKDYIQKELNYGINNQGLNDHFLEFTLELGESYTTTWVANDFIFNADRIGLTTDSGLVPGGSDLPHNYSEGDLIYIDSLNPALVLPGYWRVIEVIDATTFITNQPWITSGAAFNIDTRYADNRATIFDSLESTNGTLFNGAIQFDEWANYDDDFNFNTTGKLITTLEYDTLYNVQEDDYFTFNFSQGSGNSSVQLSLNQGGSWFTLFTEANALGTLGFGPGNIIDNTGIPSFAVGAEIWMRFRNNVSTVVSDPFKFIIADGCSKFETNKIVWLDRLGGWKTYNFNLHTVSDIATNKTKFKRNNIGTFNTESNNIDVDTEKFGETVEHSHFNQRYNIFADRLTQNNIYMVEDLFTSRFVYLLKDGILTPIIIEDNNYEISDLLYRRRKTLNITYRKSNKKFNN